MIKAASRRLAAGGLAGTFHALSAERCGAQVRHKPVEGTLVIGAKRRAARVLDIEHVEHAAIAGFIEVRRHDVGAGGAERAT